MKRAGFLALALFMPVAPALASAPVVFFDWDSARISPQAAAILDSIALQAKREGFVIVRVTGGADRSGSAALNRTLSIRRAEAVRDYLAGRGMPRERMEVVGHGETKPLVETADGVHEPQNRYVIVEFGT